MNNSNTVLRDIKKYRTCVLLCILLMLQWGTLNAQYYIGNNPTTEEESLSDKYETTMEEVDTQLTKVEDFTTRLNAFAEYAAQLQELATIAAMLTQDQNTADKYDAVANFAEQLQKVVVLAETIENLADYTQGIESEASELPFAELFLLADVDLPDISGITLAFDVLEDLDIEAVDIAGVDDDIAVEIAKGVTGSLTPANYSIDYLNQDNYSELISWSKKMAIKAIITTIYIHTMQNVIVDEADSIIEISNDFNSVGIDLKTFVNVTSMGYIEYKYPLIPSIGYGSTNTFGNYATRLRFRSKLDTELGNIESYIATDNPIAEDERIYLVLDTVEKIIKTTLENEGL